MAKKTIKEVAADAGATVVHTVLDYLLYALLKAVGRKFGMHVPDTLAAAKELHADAFAVANENQDLSQFATYFQGQFDDNKDLNIAQA